MGAQEVDSLGDLFAPSKTDRDLVWPAQKFNSRKHSKFHKLCHALAFDSLSGCWGIYNLGRLREVPTYLVPERAMTRTERETPFDTYSLKMKRKVRLYFFARLEPGRCLT